MHGTVDLTPTPRILRTLGDIPFEAWQCFAELLDNSLDAFKESQRKGVPIDNPRIDIVWSSDMIPAGDREILIVDNGPGMLIETMQMAAKAGYSTNDPIHNLGLFGMGFNIATARMGDQTIIFSTVAGAAEWVGIKIDFDELIRNGTFSAAVIKEPKDNVLDHGTKVKIKKLKDGVYSDLKKRLRIIKKRLESVYTPILEKKSVSIYLQGKQLSPQLYCIWSESRFVVRKGNKIFAVQKIDRDLGETYFDLSKNRYLTEDEVDQIERKLFEGEVVSASIVKRPRRLKGWIGIQRYSDPTEFGIDFIRNGRKILVGDKAIFGFENPETGTIIQEYPVELSSTIGGRIVGEIHVDYLIPSYQKNSFDSTGRAWRLTVEALRGVGPILPDKRGNFGYDGENDSPIGRLVNGYRRFDPGTKNLAITNSLAKTYAKNFKEGQPDFISDDKWYKVAQEADRERGDGDRSLGPVNPGGTSSDNVDLYSPTANPTRIPLAPSTIPSQRVSDSNNSLNSEKEYLANTSERIESLSGTYAYGLTPGMAVTAWRVKDEMIKQNGQRIPYAIFQSGIEIDFFFDNRHQIIDEYPISPKQLLLFALAEKFAIRDQGITLQKAYTDLIANHLNDERINAQSLTERSASLFNFIKSRIPDLIRNVINEVIIKIAEVPAENEEFARKLLGESPKYFDFYQNGHPEAVEAVRFIPNNTVIRLIASFPELFLDKKLFDYPYKSIDLGNDDSNIRLRKVSLEKVVALLNDATLIFEVGKQIGKHELTRNSFTLSILENRIVQ